MTAHMNIFYDRVSQKDFQQSRIKVQLPGRWVGNEDQKNDEWTHDEHLNE